MIGFLKQSMSIGRKIYKSLSHKYLLLNIHLLPDSCRFFFCFCCLFAFFPTCLLFASLHIQEFDKKEASKFSHEITLTVCIILNGNLMVVKVSRIIYVHGNVPTSKQRSISPAFCFFFYSHSIEIRWHSITTKA